MIKKDVLSLKQQDAIQYEIIFNNAYEDIISTIRVTPNYGIQELEAYLHNLYVIDGNDWLGRGARKDMVWNATIAACESILCTWKSRPNFIEQFM